MLGTKASRFGSFMWTFSPRGPRLEERFHTELIDNIPLEFRVRGILELNLPNIGPFIKARRPIVVRLHSPLRIPVVFGDVGHIKWGRLVEGIPNHFQ